MLCQHTPVTVQLVALKEKLLPLWWGVGVEDLSPEVLDRVEPGPHSEAGHSSVTAGYVDLNTLRNTWSDCYSKVPIHRHPSGLGNSPQSRPRKDERDKGHRQSESEKERGNHHSSTQTASQPPKKKVQIRTVPVATVTPSTSSKVPSCSLQLTPFSAAFQNAPPISVGWLASLSAKARHCTVSG